MSTRSQEEIELSATSNDNKSAFYERKQQSKAIRVLTVLAYVLSVSLAAIILSAYYIFVWDGKPTMSYQTCVTISDVDSEINDNFEMSHSDGTNLKRLPIESVPKTLENSTKSENLIPEESNVIANTDNSSNQRSEPTMSLEETMYLTSAPEENSTWSPEIQNEFENDYNDFKTEQIFIKKLFGYRKVKVK